MTRAELAAWWWNLTPEEREKKRKAFMDRFNTDPVFHSQVRKLLWKKES